MNHDLAESQPANADVDDIDVIFVEENDDIVNPPGAKGVGEIGILGVPAGIAPLANGSAASPRCCPLH